MIQARVFRDEEMLMEKLLHHCPRIGDMLETQQRAYEVEDVRWQFDATDPFLDRDVVHIHVV